MSVTASFTRDSVAYMSDGTQVRSGVPRFEPGKFGQAVMVEEGTTNKILYSEQFDASKWLKTNVTVTANATTAPNGITTADKIVENTSTGTHYVVQGVTLSSTSAPVAMSLYVKPAGRTKVQLYAISTGQVGATFDLSALTATDAVNNGTVTHKSITPIGNGWYRIAVAGTASFSTASPNIVFRLLDNNGNFSYTGDGTSGVYVWGAQVEEKQYPTSYIPTTSSTATRSPETLTIPGSVLNPQEGTVECWVYVPSVINANDFACILQIPGASGTGIAVWYRTSGNWELRTHANDNTYTTGTIPVSFTPTGCHLFSVKWTTTQAVLYIDGVARVTLNNPKLPSSFAANAYIGSNNAGGQQLNTLFDDLRISSRARTDAEIAAAYASGQPLPIDQYTTCKLDFDGTLRYKTSEFKVYHNTPDVGYIQWRDLDIRYKGITYNIPDGYTNKKFVWWDYDYPYQLQTTDIFPSDMTDDDLLVFLNKNGTAVVVPKSTVVPGDLIVPGSILADHLSANCVTSEKILAGAVSSNHIAASAIGAEKIAAGAVVSEKIAAGAVTTDKIAAGAVTAEKINVSELSAISANAGHITAGTIEAGVVIAGKYATTDADMLSRIPGLFYVVGDERLGQQIAAFKRSSDAYDSSGKAVSAHIPRYEPGAFGPPQPALYNGEFSTYTGTNGVADGWSFSATGLGTATPSVDTQVYLTSPSSQKIVTSKDIVNTVLVCSLSQMVSYPYSGVPLKLSVWFRCSAAPAGAVVRFQVQAYDAAGNLLSSSSFVDKAFATSWTNAVVQFTTPANTASVEVEFSIWGGTGSGWSGVSTWFDSCTLSAESSVNERAVMVEESTANLLTANQSSVETGTTGFAALAGATITRDTSVYRTGVASLKVVTSGSTSGSGFETTSVSVAASASYTASVYLRGSGTVVLALQERSSGDALVGETVSNPVTLTDSWQRVVVTRAFGSTGAKARLQVRTNSAQAVTFYADCLQLEQKAYATSWVSGGSTRSTEVLVIPTEGVLSATAGTLEVYVKLQRAPGTSPQYIFGSSGSRNLVVYVGTDGKLRCDYGTGSSTVSLVGTTVLSPDVWYMVTVRWSSAGVAMFLNGSVEASSTTAPSLLFGTLAYLGSKADGTCSLDGLLDDLRISSRARTNEEIEKAYQSKEPLEVDECTTLKMGFDSTLRATTRQRNLRDQDTAVVASADSTKDTSKATYVVPQGWTSAQSTIIQAISELPRSGGKILLLEGTYTVDGRIKIPSNVTVEGVGEATVLIVDISANYDVQLFDISQANNVKIRNLVLDGNGSARSYTAVNDCGIATGSNQSDFAGNVEIVGCTVKNFKTAGIKVTTTSKAMISGCLVQGNEDGIVGGGTLIVTSCTCLNNRGDGMWLVGGYGLVVSSCRSEGNGNNGIDVDAASYALVSGNTVRSNGWHGIVISTNCVGCSILSNQVYDNSKAADNTYSGICVSASCNYNTIQSNIVRKGSSPTHKYGIRINDSTCSYNVVTNNDLASSGVTASFSDSGTGTITSAGNRL